MTENTVGGTGPTPSTAPGDEAPAGNAVQGVDRRLVAMSIVIVAGAFLSALDATIVSVALDTGRGDAPRPDIVGLLLLSPAIAALVYGMSLASEGSTTSPGFTLMLAALAGGAGLLVVFLVRARKEHPSPAIDLRLFRRPPVALSAGLIFPSGAALFGMMFLLPLFHQPAPARRPD